MKTLLFVDDAPEILNAIKRSFFDTDYEVLTALSGKDALAMMAQKNVNLVVSDLRMPGMDGYEFLSAVKRKYPKVIRIILSGYADEGPVLKALQKNIAKVYLFKPWDNETLLKLVEQLFDTEDVLLGNHILSLINNAEELPTVKSSYRNIITLIDQDAEISEITKAIERDQTIATKMLHIANSAFYGLRTGSVAQAVRYLGLNTTRSLVLTTPVIDATNQKGPASQFANHKLEVALWTNRTLNLLYERFLHKKLEQVSNIAGLLHNIGKTLLSTVYKSRYLSVYRQAMEQKIPITDAEREAFQVTYAEAGGYLLQWWDMPYSIVEAALYHNEPFDERIVNKEVVLGVHIARHYAAMSLNVEDYTPFFDEAFDALQVDKEKFEDEAVVEFNRWKRI